MTKVKEKTARATPKLIAVLLVALIASLSAMRYWKERDLVGTRHPARGAELADAPGRPDGYRFLGGEAVPQIDARSDARGPEDGALTSQRSGVLDVRVFSSVSGAPLPGIVLELAHQVVGSEAARQDFKTDVGIKYDSMASVGRDGHAIVVVPAEVALVLIATGSEGGSIAELNIEEFQPGEERALDWALPVPASPFVAIRVVDDESGQPLRSAWAERANSNDGVIINDRGEPTALSAEEAAESASPEWSHLPQADAEGVIHVQLHSWAPQPLRIRAPEYSWEAIVVAAEQAARNVEKVVRLRRPAGIVVTVVRSDSRGCEGVGVELVAASSAIVEGRSASSFSNLPRARWTAVTDEEGTCKLTELPPGLPLELALVSGEERIVHQPRPLVLNAGEMRNITLAINAHSSVVGVLRTLDGIPVSGATIYLEPASARGGHCLSLSSSIGTRKSNTSPSGSFSFENVSAGDWIIGCSSEGPYASVSKRLSIESGPRRYDVNLFAASSIYIEGVVQASERGPVSAFVLGMPDGGGCVVMCETEADGAFRLGPLLPETYCLVAKSGPAMAAKGLAESQYLRFRAGSSGVSLVLAQPARISGYVMYDGAGFSGKADLTLVKQGVPRGWSSLAFARTGSNGAFSLTGVAAGKYALIATSSSNLIAFLPELSIANGESLVGVQLTMAEGARVRLSYRGADSSATVVTKVNSVTVHNVRVNRGESSQFVIPTGSIRIEAFLHDSGGVMGERSLRADPGAELIVVFE